MHSCFSASTGTLLCRTKIAEACVACCVAQTAEEQAALDALSELAMQQPGAEAVLRHPSHVVQDVASKAFGRAPSPDVTLAAVHALATIAGIHHASCLWLDLVLPSQRPLTGTIALACSQGMS